MTAVEMSWRPHHILLLLGYLEILMNYCPDLVISFDLIYDDSIDRTAYKASYVLEIAREADLRDEWIVLLLGNVAMLVTYGGSLLSSKIDIGTGCCRTTKLLRSMAATCTVQIWSRLRILLLRRAKNFSILHG